MIVQVLAAVGLVTLMLGIPLLVGAGLAAWDVSRRAPGGEV